MSDTNYRSLSSEQYCKWHSLWARITPFILYHDYGRLLLIIVIIFMNQTTVCIIGSLSFAMVLLSAFEFLVERMPSYNP